MDERPRSVEIHLTDVLNTVRPLEPFPQPLMDAHGCVLAEDVTAPWPLPAFDNSAMDGYAVRAQDTAPASESDPVRLKVVGAVPAGSTHQGDVAEGTAVRIMTGSALPAGADAVVPVEHTNGWAETVEVHRPASVGQHIRQAGDDLPAGASALATGTTLGAPQIALAAALGRDHLRVRPRVRVVVIATGSELVPPGRPLTAGKVPDSNSYLVALAAREAGAVAFRTGIVGDDPKAFLRVLDEQQIRADVIVTTGGVSMGTHDVVKQALATTRTFMFSRVAMQPGMPQGFGTLGPERMPVFALPGNPVSAYVSFQVFVRPALRLMMGRDPVEAPVRVPVATDLVSPAGKQQYLRASASAASGSWQVTPVGGPGSHLLGGLSAANALIVVPPATTAVAAGDHVDAIMLDRPE